MKTHVIGEFTRVEGELAADGNLRIAGQITGRIRVEESVVIEPTARVVGEISAAAVVVRGSFEGRIAASGRITLETGSITQAALECTRIGIAEGAQFRGTIFTADESATMRVQPLTDAPAKPDSVAAIAAPQAQPTTPDAAPDAAAEHTEPAESSAAEPVAGEAQGDDTTTVPRTRSPEHAAVEPDDGPETFVMPGAIALVDDRGEPTTETTTDNSPAQVALLADDAMQPGPRKGRRR